MSASISLRLNQAVRDELETEAFVRGIGLTTLLQDLAIAAARDLHRARIRQASERVGSHVAASGEAAMFFEDWSSPTLDLESA